MNINLFLDTLPYMAKGMAGIFCVTLLIIICIYLLNWISNKLDKKEEK